ncbi:hypothetical protein MNV49_005805 [Pseudohyphozyma bogoriensis]|nr:hypothetical protein MNV49_005805 [Pseudohyphozyma bogoriensis]
MPSIFEIPPIASTSALPDSPPEPATTTTTASTKGKSKRRLRPNGLPFTRQGKVVSTLRLLQATTEESELKRVDVGRRGVGGRLMEGGLRAALSWHLLNLGSGQFATANCPPLVDLRETHKRILKRSLEAGADTDPHHEVLIACLVALGSRRSNHSGIIGVNVVEEVGTRRETSCRALAQRCVDLAVESRLLGDNSERGKEVASVLRVTLFAVSPRHPFTQSLAEQLHRHRICSSLGHSSTIKDHLGLNACDYDTYTAVLFRRQPVISDEELVRRYCWREEKGDVELSWENLENMGRGDVEELAERFHTLGRGLNITVLRRILRLQQLVDSTPPPPFSTISTSLQYIWRLADQLESGMLKLAYARDRMFLEMGPSLLSTSMFHEAVICLETRKLVERATKEELGEEAKRVAGAVDQMSRWRFVRWLKPFVNLTREKTFTEGQGATYVHSLALLLSSLDLCPDWIPLVLEAAKQHAEGVGPYASLGLSYNDVRQLNESLKQSSYVFARSGRQHRNLSKVMNEMGVGEQMEGEPEDPMAFGMVKCALQDLEWVL